MNNIAAIIERAEKMQSELDNMASLFAEAEYSNVWDAFSDAAESVEGGVHLLTEIVRRRADHDGQ